MAERLTFQTARTATDEALAVAAQVDVRNFDRLYERYADRIYAYALSRTGSPETADDLVGETMLAALENLHRFDPERGSFATWIFTLASRRIADQRRAHRRFWRYVTNRWRPDPPAIDLTEWAERAEEDARVRRAIGQLTAAHREVIALRYVADLPIADIAALLSISDGAVKMRLNRALTNVAGILEEDDRGA